MIGPCMRFRPSRAKGRPEGLFDSTAYPQHLKARAICATCPLVAACLTTALSVAAEKSPANRCERGPDGTWAGLLWVNGAIQTMPYRAVEEVAA